MNNISTALKIYVFPAAGGGLVFQPRILKPITRLEYAGTVVSLITRKWRFQISDFFGEYWHQLGPKYPRIFKLGNKMTTRVATDEYFLKQIPKRTEHIEFIYPCCVPEEVLQEYLKKYLKNPAQWTEKTIKFGLFLPLNVLFAKVLFYPANILFAYHAFRFSASLKCYFGSNTLQRLLNAGLVKFTKDPQLQRRINELSKQVSKELNNEGVEWRWDGKDIHDQVVDQLKTELKIPDLLNSYRRARMEVLVHGKN